MAPAEKFGASLPTTSAAKFCAASFTPACSIWIVSPPIAFIFEWNSTCEHAVAEVDQAGAGVLLDDASPDVASSQLGARSRSRESGRGVGRLGRSAAQRRVSNGPAPSRSPSASPCRCRRASRRSRRRSAPRTRASGPASRAGTRRPCPCRRRARGCGRRPARSSVAASSDGSFGRLLRAVLERLRIEREDLVAGLSCRTRAPAFAPVIPRATICSTNAGSANCAHRRPRRAARRASAPRAPGRRRRRCPPCGTSRSSGGRSRAR